VKKIQIKSVAPLQQGENPQFVVTETESSPPYRVTGVIGCGLIILAYFLGSKTIHLHRFGHRTPGKIIAYEKVASKTSQRYAFHPVVVFNFENRQIQFTDPYSSSSGDWSKVPKNADGTTTVLFDPDDLKTAIIDRGLWLWLVPGTAFGFGAFLLFTSIQGRSHQIQRTRQEEKSLIVDTH